MRVESGYILQAEPTQQIKLAKEPFLYQEKEKITHRIHWKAGQTLLRMSSTEAEAGLSAPCVLAPLTLSPRNIWHSQPLGFGWEEF